MKCIVNKGNECIFYSVQCNESCPIMQLYYKLERQQREINDLKNENDTQWISIRELAEAIDEIEANKEIGG